ncbi:O-acetyl-ADP-ribose deacetylase [bacterium RCC_150]
MQIEISQGDITKRDVDAIVNAANSSLMGGGGVDGAIHRAAGPGLHTACLEVRVAYPNGLPVGQAVATPGFKLPARWVIHTVGPNMHVGQNDPALLASCFRESLKVAASLRARSLAFPAISAGIYGWEARDVARIALDGVRDFERSSPENGVDLVEFVLFNAETTNVFRDVFEV